MTLTLTRVLSTYIPKARFASWGYHKNLHDFFVLKWHTLVSKWSNINWPVHSNFECIKCMNLFVRCTLASNLWFWISVWYARRCLGIWLIIVIFLLFEVKVFSILAHFFAFYKGWGEFINGYNGAYSPAFDSSFDWFKSVKHLLVWYISLCALSVYLLPFPCYLLFAFSSWEWSPVYSGYWDSCVLKSYTSLKPYKR